jgi:hypothetical protein
MTPGETTLHGDRVLFTRGEIAFTVRDLIDWASFRGELEPLWQELLGLVAAEKLADERDLELDDSAIDSAAEAFRYEHDLITAEETEQWLAARGLSLADFSDYLVRHYWADLPGEEAAPERLDYFSAPNELRKLLTTELTFSGQLDRMARRLSWRVAARCQAEGKTMDEPRLAEERNFFFGRTGLTEEQLAGWLASLGRDAAWFEEALAREAVHAQVRDALLTPQARARELAVLRLPLTRFDVETIELDSEDAAREALLCVREDEMPMAEVAAEGRYPYHRIEILLEDVPEDLQQKFLSVTPGDVLDPIPRGDGFQVCRVMGKAEPDLDDAAVKNRAERRILDRHFAELTAQHIQWQNLPLA